MTKATRGRARIPDLSNIANVVREDRFEEATASAHAPEVVEVDAEPDDGEGTPVPITPEDVVDGIQFARLLLAELVCVFSRVKWDERVDRALELTPAKRSQLLASAPAIIPKLQESFGSADSMHEGMFYFTVTRLVLGDVRTIREMGRERKPEPKTPGPTPPPTPSVNVDPRFAPVPGGGLPPADLSAQP